MKDISAERIYAALIRVYPRPFLDEYGGEMLDAFRQMRRVPRQTGLRFWLFVVADTLVAAMRERLETLRWTATALFGLLVTVITANTTIFAYQYFYHPYFEGTAIPALPYGAALGLVLGASVAFAQWLLFPRAERRAGRWARASAVALPVAILFCSAAVERAVDGVNPVIAPPHPQLFDVLVIGLGRPGTWIDLATQFSAMALSALLVRAFMLRFGAIGKKTRHAH